MFCWWPTRCWRPPVEGRVGSLIGCARGGEARLLCYSGGSSACVQWCNGIEVVMESVKVIVVLCLCAAMNLRCCFAVKGDCFAPL